MSAGAHRPILAPVVRAALAAALCAWGCHHHGPAPAPSPPPGEVWITPQQMAEAEITLAPVQMHDLEHEVLASGRVTFDDTLVSHVFSPVSGRVTQIIAPLGAHVHKGDPLALIESPDIGVASSDVDKARADLIAAQHNYLRQKDLFQHHAASQLDFETAQDNYRKAQAELERAQERLRLLSGHTTGVTQGYTVRAPIDGEVISRSVNPGMEVQSQYSVGSAAELFTIGSIDRVWVLADVFEMDLAQIHVGARATVQVVAYPNEIFTGRVDWISDVLDPVLRTAKVRCTFDNPQHKLRPEMYATVRISAGTRPALAIPRKALFRSGNHVFVFLDRGPAPTGAIRLQRYPVVADEGSDRELIAVTRGLSPGERIAVTGVPILRSLLSTQEEGPS